MTTTSIEERRGEDPGTAVEEVVLGVDTHLEAHVGVALDGLGRCLGELTLPTTEKGYQGLVSWAEDFGRVRCAGVEGTSSYGAGLARPLDLSIVHEGPEAYHLVSLTLAQIEDHRLAKPFRSQVYLGRETTLRVA
jgi:hypothetical protein